MCIRDRFELGRIVRDYPEPQEDYLTTLTELDMKLDRQENQFASVELELWEMLRIRKDHHEPTHFIQIPYSYYQKSAAQSLLQKDWESLNLTQQSDVDIFLQS